MAYNLATSRSGKRESMAQVNDLVVIANGIDSNLAVDLRSAQATKILGIAAPGSGATATAGAAGNVRGYVRYRFRWVDSSTNTISLPSADVTVTANPNLVQVTFNKSAVGSVPARADFWIVERTTAGGSTFYPLNKTSSAEFGTAIATGTYVDNLADATIERRQVLNINQSQPSSGYKFAFSNGRVMWLGGGPLHTFNATINNASATLTGSGFTSAMEGRDFSIDADTDGYTYKVLTFTNATTMTLASNYNGSNQSAAAATIAGQRDTMIFSEPSEPEYFGYATFAGLSNITRYGEDGEPVTAGIGLGGIGVLIAKETRLFLHTYFINPRLRGDRGGDGEIKPLNSRRGALNERCLQRIGSYVYGCDVYGVWRLIPGGEPEDISGPLQNDWRGMNFAQADNFILDWDPALRLLYVLPVEGNITYPDKAYIWDLDNERWIGTREFPLGVTATCRLPDINRMQRLCFFMNISGSASAYGWFLNIGTSGGVPPTVTTLTSTITSGTATTITKTGAGWPTTGEALKGIAVKLVRASDSSEETQIIVSNTATVLTTTAFTGTAPTANDTYILGPIEYSWKTGRLNAGYPSKKKLWKRAYVWILGDTAAVTLKCRVFYDGASSAHSDRLTRSEDGVATTAGKAAVTLDPTAQKFRYYVPLGNENAVDMQFEIYGDLPGKPWQILGPVEIEYDVDDSQPARRT